MKLFLSTVAAFVFVGTVHAAEEQRQLQVSSVARDLLNAVNAVRTTNGVGALCLNAKLATASQVQAVAMAEGNFISAVGTGGSLPTTRAEAQKFNTTAGGVEEIVGAGYMNATHAVQEWMSSPAYSKYVLGDYKFLGAGFSLKPQQSYWVLDFAKNTVGEVCV